jgi:hypothetical protein
MLLMLDGRWRLEVADDRGLVLRGEVVLRGGAINGLGDLPGITGQYECEDDLMLGMLDVVLRTADTAGGETTQRFQLHIQGRIADETIAASGTDLAEPGRRVALRFEHRSSWIPERQDGARSTVPATGLAATRFHAAGRRGSPIGGAFSAPRAARFAEDTSAGPVLARARLPLAIREEAALRLRQRHHQAHVASPVSSPAPEPRERDPAGAPSN